MTVQEKKKSSERCENLLVATATFYSKSDNAGDVQCNVDGIIQNKDSSFYSEGVLFWTKG